MVARLYNENGTITDSPSLLSTSAALMGTVHHLRSPEWRAD